MTNHNHRNPWDDDSGDDSTGTTTQNRGGPSSGQSHPPGYGQPQGPPHGQPQGPPHGQPQGPPHGQPPPTSQPHAPGPNSSYGPPPPGGGPQVGNQSPSVLAIGALVCGIASWTVAPLISGIAAAIMGFIEWERIESGQSPEAGKMFAIIGGALGALNAALGLLTFVFFGLFFCCFLGI